MSLINCPECNGQVSDSAEICPHCGYGLQRVEIKKVKHKSFQLSSSKYPKKYANPKTGMKANFSGAPIFALFFGVFYLLYKGLTLQAVLWLALAFVTVGVSWLILPFIINKIVFDHKTRNGWVPA